MGGGWGGAGKKSKHALVPGERFPPCRGNSSDPNLTPAQTPVSNTNSTKCKCNNVQAAAFYLSPISPLSEMCQNMLK